jgi:hypothetical protein
MPINTDRLPAPVPVPDWPWLDGDDVLMSNFDRKVNADVADRLRAENKLGAYPGWNFHATCWVGEDSQFHAAVFTYHIHRATLSAATPEELMALVCAGFGED